MQGYAATMLGNGFGTPSFTEGVQVQVIGGNVGPADAVFAGVPVRRAGNVVGLFAVPERNVPQGGVFWCDATWHADADGLIWTPPRDGVGWWVIDASGYGPVSSMNSPPAIALLVPGVDVPVQVVDWQSRPVVGARVGLCQGCGHTPDVRNAITDAAGIAWLRDVEPTGQVGEEAGIRDLYVHASGHDCVYQTDVDWWAGAQPIVLRTIPVADVRGRIVDSTGAPIGGVAVGGTYHRGPWATTDSDGKFTLIGLDAADAQVWVRHGARAWVMQPSPTGRPLEITLPDGEPPDRPQTHLRVTVRDRGTGEPMGDISVNDGSPRLRHPGVLAGFAKTDDQGVARLDVVAGALELRIAESRPLHFQPEIRHVVVTGDTDAEIDVTLARLPVRTVTVDGPFHGVARVTASGRELVDDLIRNGAPVPLPTDEPFVLVVEDKSGHEQFFPFATLPAAAIELRPAAPTRVRVRIVGPDGRPLAAWATILPKPGAEPEGDAITDAHGRIDLTTFCNHGAFLEVRADDPRWRPAIVRVTLPATGTTGLVDLGDVRLTATPQLRLRHRDGTPARGTATILRPGLLWSRKLADDGGCDGLMLQSGDRVTVSVDWPHEADPPQALPWTTRLSGNGPWELTIDDAGIDFTFVDQHGLCLPVVNGYLGMFDVGTHTERLRLRGLAAGPFELFVGAAESDGARITGWLQPGERRVATIVLHRP